MSRLSVSYRQSSLSIKLPLSSPNFGAVLLYYNKNYIITFEVNLIIFIQLEFFFDIFKDSIYIRIGAQI